MYTKIKLLSKFKRPAIHVHVAGMMFTALFDTGSVIPVFTGSYLAMKKIGAFPFMNK